MKKLITAVTLVGIGSLTLQNFSVAHGGTYRGPGDTVPPGSGGGGGGGPSTPGPGGPSTPGPSGPSTPGPATGAPSTPGGPAARPATGSGPSGPDLTTWQFWWGFNKDPYLNLKAHIALGSVVTGSDDFFTGNGTSSKAKDTMRPSEDSIRNKIVPALVKALKNERSNHIITGCLVALAKVGDAKSENGKSEMFDYIRPFLSAKGDAEIGETAAVSLGILANDSDEIIDLLGNILDNQSGKLHDKYKDVAFENEVPVRTRAFAAYGLGLIGYRSTDDAKKAKILSLLATQLDHAKRTTQRDVPVACITSIGLVALPYNADEAPSGGGKTEFKNRVDQMRFLIDYYKDDNNEFLNRAHVPTALARLMNSVPTSSKLRAQVIKLLVDDLAKESKAKAEVQMSCAMALGQIGTCSNNPLDVEIRKTLLGSAEFKDAQTQYFSLISVAQVGGHPGAADEEPLAGLKDVRKFLTDTLAKGKGNSKSWAGLSVGVLERALKDNKTNAASADMTKALSSALADCKAPMEIGAYSIGLGLMQDLDAKLVVKDKFEKVSDADAQGYCAVGLGLMNDQESIKPIKEVILKSKYKPDLLRSAAIALGLLGDKQIAPDLVTMLGEATGQASQAAIASALGYIGDARSVEPLVKFLEDKDKTDGARGFAAAALGIVADKEELPWNSKISVNLNYRANTASLFSPDAGTGILDIL